MNFSIAISPCPNDTFIFYALIHKKVSLDGIHFDFHFKDIEELNLAAINAQYDLCKISYALVPEISKNYAVLSAGGALGNGCGPLLISHQKNLILNPTHSVILPGKHTTANALFSHFYPSIKNTSYQLFSSIETALQKKTHDAGVLIHEGRFTFMEKGLFLIADLGELWEKKHQLPIPLGGIIIAHSIDLTIQKAINAAIIKSIEYAWANMDEVLAFCKSYAQELNKEVMINHIQLYVNKYSINLRDEGKLAIKKLFTTQNNKNSCNFAAEIRFID